MNYPVNCAAWACFRVCGAKLITGTSAERGSAKWVQTSLERAYFTTKERERASEKGVYVSNSGLENIVVGEEEK